MNEKKQTAESAFFKEIYPKGFMPYRIKWFDIAIASAITLLVLILYIKTLAPSLIAGDSGELTTEIYQMGSLHPPGYPLYGILGKIFTFIPVGDIAYRVNLYVAVSGAMAIFMFYLVMIKLLGLNRDTGKINLSVHLPAVAASFIFAFSYDFWQQSSASGKFYSLNVLLVASMLYVMLIWYEEIIYYRNDIKNHFAERMTVLLAFVMGLSLTDHMLPLWFIVAYIIFMLPFALYVTVKDGSVKFKKEFGARTPSIIVLLVLSVVSIVLLVKYVFDIRLIYPAHMPLILIGWFLVPSYISVYTILSKVKKQYTPGLFALFVVAGIAALVVFSIYANANSVIQISPQYQLYLFSIDTVENGIPQSYQIDPALVILLAIVVMVLFFYGLYDGTVKKSEVGFGPADKFIEILTYSAWMFIFAMTLYLYLMVRNIALSPLPEPKPQSWGDTVTLDILFNHMFRKQYGGRNPDYANLGGQILAVMKVTLTQFNVAGIIFAVIGFFYFFRMRDMIWAVYTAAAYIISYTMLIYFINFQVDPSTVSTQKQYFTQLHMIIALYMSFGFQFILDVAQNKIDWRYLLFMKRNN
jgi:hypothetical protein